MNACARSDRTTAHQGKNSHSRLRLRAIAGHHASPGMFPLALSVGVEKQTSRHLVDQSAVDAERTTRALYAKWRLKSREKSVGLTANLQFPCSLKQTVPLQEFLWACPPARRGKRPPHPTPANAWLHPVMVVPYHAFTSGMPSWRRISLMISRTRVRNGGYSTSNSRHRRRLSTR